MKRKKIFCKIFGHNWYGTTPFWKTHPNNFCVRCGTKNDELRLIEAVLKDQHERMVRPMVSEQFSKQLEEIKMLIKRDGN